MANRGRLSKFHSYKKKKGGGVVRGRFQDLTGQQFGRLKVIKRDTTKDSKRTFWVCQCECGNIKSINAVALKSGATQSCGCLNKEIISKPKDLSDMIGKRFGNLVVLERDGTYVSPNGQKKPVWRCICDCGNETTVVSQDLKSGHTTSCGCLSKKKKGDGLLDLTGKRFGKLVVVERADDYYYQRKSENKLAAAPRWLCRCDCGNIVVVQGGNLRSGNTTNCGCDRIGSKSEIVIAEFLSKNNIKHLQEYSFDDLRNKSGNLLRFDFAILDKSNNVKALIEYQGAQHYMENISFGLYQRKYSDKMKKDYCTVHNIPLYEIRFDEDLEEALNALLYEIQALK